MNQNFERSGSMQGGPEELALSADLGSATVTNISREYKFSEVLRGAIGGRDEERMAMPQSEPAHAADNLIMQRNSDIIDLCKNFGDRPEVQGIVAGIVMATDLFEIRQAALYAVISRNQDLADLGAEVALKDPESTMREKMLRHLAEQDPLFATSAAVNMVRHDPDQFLRVSALELLLDLDTGKALELARHFADGSHQFNDLREFSQHTLVRTNLKPTKDESGHVVSPQAENRAALICAAMYEREPAVCFKAAQQFLANADVANTIALSFALLNHPHQSLRELGQQTIAARSPELAGLLSSKPADETR
jgi:hypothetical protein